MESFHFCRYEFSWKCSFWKLRWLDAVIPPGCPRTPLRQPPWESVLRAFGHVTSVSLGWGQGTKCCWGPARFRNPQTRWSPRCSLASWIYNAVGSPGPTGGLYASPERELQLSWLQGHHRHRKRDCLRPHTGGFPSFCRPILQSHVKCFSLGSCTRGTPPLERLCDGTCHTVTYGLTPLYIPLKCSLPTQRT